jgi:hypothetical protein
MIVLVLGKRRKKFDERAEVNNWQTAALCNFRRKLRKGLFLVYGYEGHG